MCQTRVSSLVYGSAWSNCYWFARMLLNTDQYAAPGKNERAMNILLSKVGPLMRLRVSLQKRSIMFAVMP